MKVEPVPMAWEPSLPVFARESFLRAVGDEAGWLGGFSDDGRRICVLPFTVIRKASIRMVRFRTETILLDPESSMDEERHFLNLSMGYFRSIGADLVIPASNNAIFRTFPDGADAAPYGSYVLDLAPPEDVLWRNMHRILRQNIQTAVKEGVTVRTDAGAVDQAYDLVRETFARSDLPFMGRGAFTRYLEGLGDGGALLVAEHDGKPESYAVFGFSEYAAYAIYAGSVLHQHQGANKLLYWEAIRMFRHLGARRFDFMGARVAPAEGSKQHSLASFKKRYGASLRQGFMWKFPIRPLKSWIYSVAARWRTGGDIVDSERHKLHSQVAIGNA